MAAPARFTFDLDLQQRPAAAPQPTMPETLVSQLLAQAREEAYAEGLAAGERTATATAAQTVAQAATALAAQTAQMSSAVDDASATSKREAIELAASVGRKLAANLLSRQPTAELEALIAECMQSLEGVPHLVIRCHPQIADAVREIATAHMATSGFAGRLIVMGDPDQGLGDGRLEWVDGGLVRDMDAIAAAVDEKIAAYLAATGGDPVEETH